jgi:RHS repeat-associated protein
MAKTKMMYAGDADALSEVTAQNATLSTVTIGTETYIRAVATSTARPGMFPVGNSVAVHAGERYKIRARAYRTKTHAFNLLVQVNGNDLGWPGALVPVATTTVGDEYWIEQVVKVPVDGVLVAGIVGNITAAVGEDLYLNAFEIIKLEDIAPEYQYFMKDHLGNVRLTFTSLPAAPESFATDFEGEDDGTFENYSNSTYDLIDHTDLGTVKQNVQKLNGGANGRVGVAKTFSVMPGDVISARAYGKYMNVSGTANTNTLITSLAAAFGVSATSTGDQLAVYQGLNNFASLVANGDHLDDDESAPKAFVTILFFDKDHNLVDAAWDQMTTTGAQTSATIKQPPHDEVSITATAPEPGFAYVFVSNEHPTLVDIYYDDVTFTHTPSAIVSMDDYYPFGMTFNSHRRENGLSQKYLFNGKEFLDCMDIEWYDYQARYYDAQIGRFLAVDPASETMRKFSVYSYAFDNPIRFIDPDGMMPEEVIDPKKQRNEKSAQQRVDRAYQQPVDKIEAPGSGTGVELSGSISIGLQGGFSVKVLGENMSLFVNFGSLDLVTVGTKDGMKLVDGNVKEGVEIGLGPVGVGKEIETERGEKNGDFTVSTTETTTFNLFNVEGSGTVKTDVRNPESSNSQTRRTTSTSIGASQSGKAGFGIVASGGISGRISVGGVSTVGDLNPKYVASDVTRVSTNVRPPKK